MCAVAEAGALVRVEQARGVVQALGHLVADDVHKALEHSLRMMKNDYALHCLMFIYALSIAYMGQSMRDNIKIMGRSL